MERVRGVRWDHLTPQDLQPPRDPRTPQDPPLFLQPWSGSLDTLGPPGTQDFEVPQDPRAPQDPPFPISHRTPLPQTHFSPGAGDHPYLWGQAGFWGGSLPPTSPSRGTESSAPLFPPCMTVLGGSPVSCSRRGPEPAGNGGG